VKQPGEDKRLTDYLLGNLPESEEVRLEEEYLASSDAQDRLAAVEDDLVEAFLEGQLSAREKPASWLPVEGAASWSWQNR